MKKLFFITCLLFSAAANADQRQEAILRGVGDMNVRLTATEEQNRRLQGRIEDLEYKIQQLEKRLMAAEAAGKQVAIRRENPYQQFVFPVEGQNQNVPLQNAPQQNAPAAKPATNKAQDINEIIAEDETEVEGAAEYESAFIQLGKLQYNEAEKQFKSFVAKFPNSPLVATAHYWLGEISFTNENYKDAAINYLKSYKANPKSEKAPEAMLKTASSLKALGKKDEACKNFARFLTEFPAAHATLKNSATKEMKTLGCK